MSKGKTSRLSNDVKVEHTHFVLPPRFPRGYGSDDHDQQRSDQVQRTTGRDNVDMSRHGWGAASSAPCEHGPQLEERTYELRELEQMSKLRG